MTDAQKAAQRAQDQPYQDLARRQYETLNGPDSLDTANNSAARDNFGDSAAALHRLDMVAGGSPTDIAGMGNAKINSSIGPSWNGARGDALKDYCKRMAAKNCPVSVRLIYGNCNFGGGGGLSA